MSIRKALRGNDPFRLRSTSLLALVAVIVLAGFRQFGAAGGIVFGFSLYAANLLLIIEIGRSLLRRDGVRRPKPLAAISSAGRMLFLAIALSLIAVLLGRNVVLGACGGLLIAQVNLHIPRTGH
ncbi:hypothetical protein KAR02_13490 [Candidatus Bipolaricaulota bacterium]|nr:hypothetical protein [Candidatus Bipolaricaulota bacterium]